MIIAKLRHLRISPRKVRLVTDLVKGLDVEEAERQLTFLTKRAARPILSLLNSAIANAQHNANLPKLGLYIVNVTVEPGPSLKRWRSRAMGRAAPILKRTSHVTLFLDQKSGIKEVKDKIEDKIKDKVEKEIKPTLPGKISQLAEKVEPEEKPVFRPKPTPPQKPYSTTSQSKKKFFSRQTFGNAKKYFRRKSM